MNAALAGRARPWQYVREGNSAGTRKHGGSWTIPSSPGRLTMAIWEESESFRHKKLWTAREQPPRRAGVTGLWNPRMPMYTRKRVRFPKELPDCFCLVRIMDRIEPVNMSGRTKAWLSKKRAGKSSFRADIVWSGKKYGHLRGTNRTWRDRGWPAGGKPVEKRLRLGSGESGVRLAAGYITTGIPAPKRR